MLWIAKFELADPQLGVMISEIVFCFSSTYIFRRFVKYPYKDTIQDRSYCDPKSAAISQGQLPVAVLELA